jgi:hypothetical protein
LVEVAELRRRERYEDQQRTRDLNRLVDRVILRSRSPAPPVCSGDREGAGD